ncbi:MAG TPA: 23S rRNA (adenine(2503)-C(2))-methyltransferase RlmN [Bacteriovoracaceae bacterium]|nr:23S rRNA (adenine(2503)-C(2))-methyltransferase RlmN [Bacteriovoracaceae bacterium]
MKKSFYEYTLTDLQNLFQVNDLTPTGAGKLFNWHYKQGFFSPCELEISKVSQNFISENLSFDLPTIDVVQESGDKAVKFLFKLEDGKKVETVLIPSNRRYSICLSSQVGCAMKCSFCHTGLQGLERHLKTHEIVGQLLAVQRWLGQNRTSNEKIATIVFMGQGEPLHNFDAVRKACEIFVSQHGLSLAHDKITISTAGYLPGLERWKAEMPDVNIALSLHSTNKEKRDKLIPINARYPLEKVLEVLDQIPKSRKRFVIYEYLLTKGFNDSVEDARSLGETLQGKRAFVNLIPFNPFPGAIYDRPTSREVASFKSELDKFGVPSLVRFTKGDDILAACGQLNSKGAKFSLQQDLPTESV